MKFPAKLTHARCLEFLDVERTRLQTKRQANQVSAQRFIVTVRLVKAMGGRWQTYCEVPGDER